jgi:hypothetical protein
MLLQLAIRRSEQRIDVAFDVLDKIAFDNLPLMHVLTRLVNVTAKLLAARNPNDPLASLESQLAGEMAKSVVRAMVWSGQAPTLSHHDLVELMRHRFSQQQIAEDAFYRWLSTGTRHGNDLHDWISAEHDLCSRRPW